ncbi:30S ribosomal protein S17e [Candidatus Woesearchaeota archaeon]|nr:30S ribosomal protein S17e [Candidatus Woesearchaeota archaeon]
MGRIKTIQVKRIAIQLVELHSDKFKTDFIDNKKIVEEYATIPSKKMRNVIAGYVTRLMQQKR